MANPDERDPGSAAVEVHRGLFLTVEDIERLVASVQGSMRPHAVISAEADGDTDGDTQPVPAAWCGIIFCGGVYPTPKAK